MKTDQTVNTHAAIKNSNLQCLKDYSAQHDNRVNLKPTGRN